MAKSVRNPSVQDDGSGETLAFHTLVVFLVVCLFTGGGSRGDIQSLVVLRPAAALACAVACLTLTRAHCAAHRFLFGLLAAVAGLTLTHLIPLPPELWQTLPGRELVATIDRSVGLGGVWRPLAMVPAAGWNALWSLLVPLAVLMLGAQLGPRRRAQLLPLVLGMILLSGLWGMLQAVGGGGRALYLYRVTNEGMAVGLFSNRNHQAITLATLFPMLAVYASRPANSEEQARLRIWLCGAAAAMLVPLLLVAGSRGGLVLGVVGLIAAVLIYHRPSVAVARRRPAASLRARVPLLLFIALCLGALTALMSRAEALRRLISPDEGESLRFKVWGSIAEMGVQYLPLGSGIGSFVEVYQIGERFEQLRASYLNHAHNELLEVFLTAGIPGLLLVALALYALARAGLAAFRAPAAARGVELARLGAIVLAMFAVGSIADYPLRTPTIAAIAMIAALWLRNAAAGKVIDEAGKNR